jgi:hypothetical protein
MKMAWCKVTVRQPYEGFGGNRSLPQEFHRIYLSEGEPKDAALFSSRDIQNGYQCHYYFSPAAAVIAWSLLRRYRAVECAAPKGVTFVVGDLSVMDDLRQDPESA